NELLEWIGADEETIRLYELREKAIHDEVTRLQGARKEGMEKGVEKGIEKGRKEGMVLAAKNMLENDIDIETVMKVTGLKIEEVKDIKENLH
ncbi:MAG: hypothetical protein ACLFMO_07365, partial [Eubacteriales bacterium]